MLKVRVIPTLLWKGPGLVKGVSFDSWRRVGSVLPALKIYDKRDVDELALLDIAATAEGRGPDVGSVRSLGKSISVPLTVGGGITDIQQIAELLGAGADKVSINTAAHENPGLVSEAARYFGSQCVVVSIDVVLNEDRTRVCMSRCGSKPENTDPVSFARKMADLGAGEILLTSVERDGTMQGYDLDLIEAVVGAVNIPVIASGGAGNYQHFVDAVKLGGASAVAAASIFHFTDKTPAEAKKFMANAGIPVREGLIKSDAL